jgi:hypothetical protein
VLVGGGGAQAVLVGSLLVMLAKRGRRRRAKGHASRPRRLDGIVRSTRQGSGVRWIVRADARRARQHKWSRRHDLSRRGRPTWVR